MMQKVLTRMQFGCLSSHFGGYRASLGCEKSCFKVLGMSNFNRNLSTLVSSSITMYLELACHFKVRQTTSVQ